MVIHTGGIGHALSSCLLGCGIGVWLGTSGVVAPMSGTSQSVFWCILHNFAFGGKSVTPPTDHGSMSCLMFGVCVLCCQKRSTVAVCDECKEHYCTECIDTHTCGTNGVC